jgi:hypothetical protein
MAQPNPKLYQTDQVHFLVAHVDYNDTGISSGIRVGTLPAGCIIVGTDVLITTAFNAGTTNVLTAGGNSSSFNDIVASGDVDETATGLTQNIKPTGSSLGRLAADRDVYVMYAQTGTAASAGSADVIVKYIPITNVANA